MSKTIRVCPKCGTPVPEELPHGLCPRCVLASVATGSDPGRPEGKRAEPPSLERVSAAFPQLEVLELIGAGGMGAVFKARQPKLDRLVALKVLPESLAADPAFAGRFSREARTLARLNHPNIVTVHDFGESGGFFYLLMELVDGENLRHAMQAGRFTPQQALALVPKVCEALQFAHGEGVLHRDIKPENILLDSKGRVKIADFGIAKLVGEPGPATKLTATGAMLGTPNYMAPEQIEHPEDVDQRADIYSLGVVFYELLTGDLPIGRFPPPSEKTPVDPRVDAIVFRTLEREREKRYHCAGEVKTSVENITNPGAATAAAVDYPKQLPGSGQPFAPPPSGKASALPWSRKAITAALLTGIGFFPPLLLIVIAFFLALPGDHSFSALNAQTQFVLGVVLCLLPGLSGALLGSLALGDIRRAQGQLRGRQLAFFATLFWPLLLINTALLWILLVTIVAVVVHYTGTGLGWLMLPLSLLALLGLDFLVCAKLWRWATKGDIAVPGRGSSFAPAAIVLCLALALSVPCLVFGFAIWMPMLAKVSRQTTESYPVQSSDLRESSMVITEPLAKRFTASWTVFSNNIPVIGPEIFAELPAAGRAPRQLKAEWRLLGDADRLSNAVPWEVILIIGSTNRMVSSPTAGRLPNLDWKVSPAQNPVSFKSSIENSFEKQILHAEGPETAEPQGPRTRWSVKLTLKSSARLQPSQVGEARDVQTTQPSRPGPAR